MESSGKKTDFDFKQRKKQLMIYLDKAYPKRDYAITKLNRSFGPGMFTSAVEAIVVSTETAPRVAGANKKRREIGLPDLKIEIVPMIMAGDENRISSTRIRAGEIDAEGNVLSQA